jgi:hypothetical protein
MWSYKMTAEIAASFSSHRLMSWYKSGHLLIVRHQHHPDGKVGSLKFIFKTLVTWFGHTL